MSLVRGGKTRPRPRGGKGSSGSSDVVVLQKKKTTQGPKRKRSVVQFEERRAPRAETEAAAGTEAAGETEVEAPSSKRPKKRTPKKKLFTSDVRYGGPFGGAADFFGWEPSVAEKEKMPCTEGAAKSQPMRTKRMQDMEGVTTPYLVRPSEIAVRREDVDVGFVGRGGCSLTDSRIKFYATFLAPIRQLVEPHDLVVETARQLQWSRDRFSFEVGKHANPFRGCLGDIPGFRAWGEHICDRHGAVLEVIGIRSAILATGDGFWKVPNIVNAFLSFWSPSTNSFIFPFGEMSITLWDLKGICGLPIMGAPFDECTPPGTVLQGNRLVAKIMDVMDLIVRGDNSAKYTSRSWVELFGRISDPRVDNSKWPATSGEFHAMLAAEKRSKQPDSPPTSNRLWISLEDLRKVDPEVELALFLWLWLSVVICPSSTRHGLTKWTCLWMACEMAVGKRFALAPRVLCDIYRGLNEAIYYEEGPGSVSTYFPAHFLIGWLGFYFPGIYGIEDVAEFAETGVVLKRFAHRNFANRSFTSTVDYISGIGRFDAFFYKMAAPSATYARSSSEECSREEKEYVLALQPGLLTLREGACYCVEPYYPQRFARQFGYDQDVPAELVEVSRAAREIGVGCSWWLATSSRFEDASFGCEVVFPGFDRRVHASYSYAYWYSASAVKAAQRLHPMKRFFAFRPWDLVKESSEDQEVNLAIRHSLERDLVATEPARVRWIDLERARRTSSGWKHSRLEWSGEGEQVYMFDKGPELGNLFDLTAARAHFYSGPDAPG